MKKMKTVTCKPYNTHKMFQKQDRFCFIIVKSKNFLKKRKKTGRGAGEKAGLCAFSARRGGLLRR